VGVGEVADGEGAWEAAAEEDADAAGFNRPHGRVSVESAREEVSLLRAVLQTAHAARVSLERVQQSRVGGRRDVEDVNVRRERADECQIAVLVDLERADPRCGADRSADQSGAEHEVLGQVVDGQMLVARGGEQILLPRVKVQRRHARLRLVQVAQLANRLKVLPRAVHTEHVHAAVVHSCVQSARLARPRKARHAALCRDAAHGFEGASRRINLNNHR